MYGVIACCTTAVTSLPLIQLIIPQRICYRFRQPRSACQYTGYRYRLAEASVAEPYFGHALFQEPTNESVCYRMACSETLLWLVVAKHCFGCCTTQLMFISVAVDIRINNCKLSQQKVESHESENVSRICRALFKHERFLSQLSQITQSRYRFEKVLLDQNLSMVCVILHFTSLLIHCSYVARWNSVSDPPEGMPVRPRPTRPRSTPRLFPKNPNQCPNSYRWEWAPRWKRRDRSSWRWWNPPPRWSPRRYWAGRRGCPSWTKLKASPNRCFRSKKKSPSRQRIERICRFPERRNCPPPKRPKLSRNGKWKEKVP